MDNRIREALERIANAEYELPDGTCQEIAREALALRAAAEKAREALAWYADPNHWGGDVWGVQSIVNPPDYGNPGTIAKPALAALEEVLK